MSANAATSPDENALFYNLCLLGIPTQATKNGIELTRQSFRKPNPRSLELVLYYLYAAICGEAKASKVSRRIEELHHACFVSCCLHDASVLAAPICLHLHDQHLICLYLNGVPAE
eukprot:1066098-Pelagomonas_calceolata.AAC.1